MDLVNSPKKKSQGVVEALLEHLRAGEWNPGERLPSERELCEAYGVSRTVIREALAALQLGGYLEARPGDGNYVLQPVAAVETKAGNPSLQAGLSVVEALEAREAMDISAAHLAIENASDEELQVAADLVREMDSAIARQDYHSYIALTLDFHNALAAASNNGFIQQTVAFLIDQIRPSLWVVEQKYNGKVAQQSFQVHRDILAAVQNRDLSAAIQAIRGHYRSYPAIRHPHQP